MPVQYGGIIDETKAVRGRAGLFDVSHMGRFKIGGPGAAQALDRVLSFDVPGLKSGRAKYGVICDDHGGIIDDTILYRRDEESFLLVPNASNADAVEAWMRRWIPGDVSVEVVTDALSMIACQGPEARGIVQGLSEDDLDAVRPFRFVQAEVAGVATQVARTGYTGEDGFELMVPSERAATVWAALVEGGATPCGLGARDVLRLEAGLLLHGNDMDTSVNPYEAGLERFVDPDRDGYVAGDALRMIRDRGPKRMLVGFEMTGRGIARQGHPILNGANPIGQVTSGSHSPTLDTNIGMGYVPTAFATVGSRFQVDVRGRLVSAQVVPLPFYSRKKSP